MPLARRAASVVAMVKPTETCDRMCPRLQPYVNVHVTDLYV